MARSVLHRLVRVGRATVFAVGAAVALAVVLGVATAALAAVPGDPLRLGRVNAINALTQLVGEKSGPMLRIDNNGPGQALQLLVEPKKPPLVVSADAGKATNLSADELDNMDGSAFLPGEIYEKSAPGTIAAGSSAGTTAYCDSGDVAVSGSYAMADTEGYLQVSSERRVDERFDGETGQVNPSGWHVVAHNSDLNAGRSITVYVNCADRPPLRPGQ